MIETGPPLKPLLKKHADQAVAWLIGRAFDVWWRRGGDPRGGFFEKLDANYEPAGEVRRFRVQARQTYCYCLAPDFGWDGPWRDAARHGVRFILDRAMRPDGLVHSLFHPDGAPAEAAFDLYDQAFALLALAHAWSRLDLPEARTAAERLRAVLLARLERPGGGFEEDHPARLPLRANPHMHLYEAALAWSEAGGDGDWLGLAERIRAVALGRFIEPDRGTVLEYFDTDLRPVAGPTAECEPGHQFEWGWLLLRHAALAGEPPPAAAMRLIDQGVRAGVDRQRDVTFNTQTRAGEALDRKARLWPQTEWLKAALAMRSVATDQVEAARWETEAAAAWQGLSRYLDAPAPGLWRDLMLEDGSFVEEAAPASSFYHIVCALDELRRATAGPSAPRP